MIKILNETNIEDLKNLLGNIDNIMGQPLDEYITWTGQTKREMLVDRIVSNWLKWDNKTRNAIGWFEDGRLRTLLCQDFSVTIKAWSMSYYFSDYKGYAAINTGTLCGAWAMEEAERVGYYEYYRVIESSKIEVFNRAWKNSIRTRYLLVVDELVPASEKPITTYAWDWLFEGNAKTVDSAIVKGILLPEYRNY